MKPPVLWEVVEPAILIFNPFYLQSPPGEIPGVAAAACGSRTAAAAAPSRDPVSSSFSSAVAGPSNQRGRRANRQSIFVDVSLKSNICVSGSVGTFS